MYHNHNGEGIMFDLLTSELVLFWENRLVRIPSFYMNEIGQ